MGAIAFTLYISAAIPERYAAWCICSGNDRRTGNYAEYADSWLVHSGIFKGGYVFCTAGCFSQWHSIVDKRRLCIWY